MSNPPPVTENWATKRSDPITTIGDDFSSPHNDIVGQKQDNSMSLLDADDDEIEIIYESAPKKQPERFGFEPQLQMRTAANGQEPPEANEIPQLNSPMNKQKTETKPLSKQQQEEAAKLAQRRRTFDNQKYQQRQSNMSCEVVPFDEVPGAVHQEDAPRSLYTSKAQHSPTTDMILGLNQADTRNRDQPQLNTFLPGGILDDIEDFRPVPQVNKVKQRKTHDDISSAGFDADDEKLMAEILEDFDA